MGGWGLDSRLWGLAMDNIEEITVVKADGSISTISQSNDPNLFWAMRGAAPSFAIATEFKAKTYAAPPEVYHFELKLELQNAQQAADAFLAYVNWGAGDSIPAELGMQVSHFLSTSICASH
jgi:FAD/FMN-containing dehydrogenase